MKIICIQMNNKNEWNDPTNEIFKIEMKIARDFPKGRSKESLKLD